jgi:hypothetical protein
MGFGGGMAGGGEISIWRIKIIYESNKMKMNISENEDEGKTD